MLLSLSLNTIRLYYIIVLVYSRYFFS